MYVLEIAKCRNITNASRQLYISQSALSQQIQRLEQELGTSLFIRTAHGIDLTSAGQQFCHAAQPVADGWVAFQKQFGLENRNYKKHLRIALGSRVYSNGLFEEIVAFFDQHPDIDVTFVTEAGNNFLTGLQDGSLDLALDCLPQRGLPHDQADLFYYDLIAEQQCVLMCADHPKSALPCLAFSDLQGEVMISGLESSMEERTLQETCSLNDIRFKRIYRSDSMSTIMELVRSGKGIVLGPRSFAPYYHVTAVPIEPPIKISLSFICARSSVHRNEIALFLSYIQGHCSGRNMSVQYA